MPHQAINQRSTLGAICASSVLLGVLVAAPAAAAEPQSAASNPSAVAADSLPFSVERIKRQLAAEAASDGPGLRLDFYVEVYGRPITLDWLGDFEALKTGPAPYGAPTHAEFVQLWTPQEFRAPVMDLSGAARALMTWLNGRGQKSSTAP